MAAPSSGQVQSSFGLIGEGTELWQDFLKYKVPIVMKSSTTHYPKQHMFVKKEEKTRRRRRTCTREVENPLTGLSHFHYKMILNRPMQYHFQNDTESADVCVEGIRELTA